VILQECYQIALKTLQEYRKKMDEIADYLFEKETITGDEFMEILKRDYFIA
jgi:cell division protease FtsH